MRRSRFIGEASDLMILDRADIGDELEMLLDEYNPNQPREPNGQWGEGGGVSVGSVKGNSAERVELRKELKGETDPAKQQAIQAKIVKSFEAQIAKKPTPELEAKLAKYRETYGVPSASAPARAHEISMSDLTKVGGQKGSNVGGVYRDKAGNEYYIKTPKTKNHVKNELIAADLSRMAGVDTMEYVPVKGDANVATRLRPLEKDNIDKFSAAERARAQDNLGAHAWVANWDAAGLGGDNQVVSGGKVVTVDVGGSLRYRAQGAPKGKAFGNKVGETSSFLDPDVNGDSADLFKGMSRERKIASYERVTKLSDVEIAAAIRKRGGDEELVKTMIARKHDLASQAAALKGVK